VAVDIDRDSVATTRKVLSAHGRGAWQAHELSVFDLPSTVKERFDVVYSWGVLHHTGDMWRALSCAAEMVAEGGTFAIALYEKTPLCGAWTLEKRAYRRLPGTMQKLLRGLYLTAWGSALVVTGRNPWRRIREGQERGMDVFHDVHDWMGGYPYESTSAPEIGGFMARLGFERVDYRPFRIIGKGVFGSGCSEYVFRKQRLARSA
jgi:2-polyprenyl-6-hydroxyphenyl methylase/3-demethylubiquinone-9 3-methyltransferase